QAVWSAAYGPWTPGAILSADTTYERGQQMKGLILAAGLGTRLRPLTSLRPKPTIAVANKPLIHYAVDNLVDAGVDHIGVVVGPPTVAAIRETLEGYRGARYEY